MAQVFSFEFCKISNNAFSYRTHPVAAFKIKSSITQVFQVQCSSIDSHDVLNFLEKKKKNCTKIKFSIKNFFNRKLRIWSHLLKKSLMENFIFAQW